MFRGFKSLSRLKNFYWRRVRKISPGSRRITIFLAGVAVLVVGILIIKPGSLRADTQGANSPSTAVNDTGIGGTAWTTPGNVVTSNDGRASVALSQNNTPSNYIKATNFGFSIPAGSTIDGLVAEVERSEGNTDTKNSCIDNAIRIVKGGAIGSTDRSQGGAWPTTDTYATYGNSSDLWGDTWGISDINASDFGFAISAGNSGSGNPNNTETCRVDHIRITVHFTLPPTTYDQSSYRWFNNNNGTDVGTALANQDTSATIPVKDTPFRLRMTLHVGTSALSQSGQNFKLQFAKKGSGSCASPEFSYADVTGSSAIQYYDNAAASDGATLTTNANDPQHSAHTTRAQTYEEANNFTNSQSSIAAGEDGLWDFALVDATADYSENYCFKAVLSTGFDVNSYGVYPEITTAAAPTIDQSAYRWFEHQAVTQGFFGTNGIVTGSSATAVLLDIAIDSTYMYVAGYDSNTDWRIEKRSLSSGALDGNFGLSGVVTGDSASHIPNAIAIDGSHMYVAGNDSNGDIRIEKRALSDGALDGNFGSSGVVTGDSASQTANDIEIDDSSIYIISTDSGLDWRIEKRSLSSGALDGNFGLSGVVTGDSASRTGESIEIDSSYMYLSGKDSSQNLRIEKRALSDGALDGNFGSSGVVTGDSAGLLPTNLAIDSTYMYAVKSNGEIEKRALSDGALDGNFGSSGVVATNSIIPDSIAIDSSYMYVGGTDNNSDWNIEKRALSDGALDGNFGSSGVVTGDSDSDSTVRALSVDDSYMYAGGQNDNGDWRIEKRSLSSGTLDTTKSDVGSALATQDMAATLTSTGQEFRLRMNLHANNNKLVESSEDFKLQLAVKGTGTCSSPEFSYADVSAPGGSEGPSPAGAGADDASIGSQTWGSPGNVAGDDGSFASASGIASTAASHYLKATGFGFSIPSGSTIDGIKVETKKMEFSLDGWGIVDNAVRIVKSGTIGSTDRSSGADWPQTLGYTSYGGSSDLWGETWTPSDINSSNFGFAISAIGKGPNTTAQVDNVRITVYYSGGNTSIRYIDSGNDGVALTDNANDPVHSGHTNNNQTYEEANNFTNSESAISAGEDGSWDFALVDDGAPGDTTYCFRVVDSSDSTLNSYDAYPEITTYNPGGTGTTADIVDAAGDPVTDPAFSLSSHTLSFDCESVSGTFASSSQRVRVANGFTAEDWSLTLAATDGATASWSGGPTDYDFNDSSGSPGGCGDGGDGDSLAGQMSFDPSVGTLTPEGGCGTTGITKGSSSSFAEGATDDLTILSGTTASDTDCYWDLTGIDVNQQIPADQPTGSYSINLTLTLTVF